MKGITKKHNMKGITKNHNVYVIGTHLENGLFAIKVGYSNDILNRLKDGDGYVVLFAAAKDKGEELVKHINNTFHKGEFPAGWFSAENLQLFLDIIKHY